jgi:hypothetical protein
MAQHSKNHGEIKTVYEIESEFHGHDGPSFDSNIAGRTPPGTLQPRLTRQAGHLDHYFQEIQRVMDYLAGCVDRLKYLKREDIDVFEDARRHHRDLTGEDPLRGWEVRMHAMMGMLRDIRDEEP